MKKLKVQVILSLVVAILLIIVNFGQLFLVIGLLLSYSLFKAMDMYYEQTN